MSFSKKLPKSSIYDLKKCSCCLQHNKPKCIELSSHQCILDDVQTVPRLNYLKMNASLSDFIFLSKKFDDFDESRDSLYLIVDQVYYTEVMCQDIPYFPRYEYEIFDKKQGIEWLHDYTSYMRFTVTVPTRGWSKCAKRVQEWRVKSQIGRNVYEMRGYGTIRVVAFMLRRLGRLRRSFARSWHKKVADERLPHADFCCDNCYLSVSQGGRDWMDVVDLVFFFIHEKMNGKHGNMFSLRDVPMIRDCLLSISHDTLCRVFDFYSSMKSQMGSVVSDALDMGSKCCTVMNVDFIKKRLEYKIDVLLGRSDPACYITPDVLCSFDRSVTMSPVRADIAEMQYLPDEAFFGDEDSELRLDTRFILDGFGM